MITISKIDSFEELLKLENEWNQLLEKSQSNIVFLSFEWIKNWWECFGDDKKLLILLVKEDDRIIGIAPLMTTQIKKFWLSINKVEFIGMPLSDYADFIIIENNKEVIQKIYGYLLENKNLWSLVKLNRIQESSPTLHLSKEVLKSKKLIRIAPYDKCFSVVLDDPNLNARLNKKNIRNAVNNLSKKGELSLSICRDNLQEAKELLNIFFEQHKQRWNDTNTPSMFNDERYKKFYLNLVASLMQKGKIAFFCLRFIQKPISIHISFLYDNKYFGYGTTYDISYAKQSPGVIALQLILKYCLSQKLSEFDLSRGGEKYKLRFANVAKENYSVSINKKVILYLLDFLSSKIESAIKKNEILYNFFIKYEKKLRIF